eukprot:scaffold40821_cov51-Cyclotella_meneghiniana.AAC.2
MDPTYNMLSNNIIESNRDIKAIQSGLRTAQELKNNTEAVFVQACNAVEVAKAHAADNEIMMAAIKKVHKSAQSSFLKARQKVEAFETSLKTAKNELKNNVITISDDADYELVSDGDRTMKGEENSQMSIPEYDKKPAAAAAPSGERTTTAAAALIAPKRVFPEENAEVPFDWFDEAIDWALEEHDESVVLDGGKVPTAVPKGATGMDTMRENYEVKAVQNICNSAKDAQDWFVEELGRCNSPIATAVQVHDNISDIANTNSEKQTTKKHAAEGKSNAGDYDGEKQVAKLCAKKSKKTTSGSVEPPQELDARGCSFSELTAALIEHQDLVVKLLIASAARGEQAVPCDLIFPARRATMRKLKLINSSMKIFTGRSISAIQLSAKMENAESAAMKYYNEYRTGRMNK